MKRLIRLCDDNINNNSLDNAEETNSDIIKRLRNEVMQDKMNENNTNMVLLDQLNEADVRHDKCPNCAYESLVRKEGFKICPQCGMICKMLDGSGYVLTE